MYVGRAISLKTYRLFCKKYKIALSFLRNDKRINKTIKQLSHEIYIYELQNKNNIINGLYFI